MIYYIYREQGYKSILPLNEKCIFENIFLVVVKMKSGTMKVVNMKFFLKFMILDISWISRVTHVVSILLSYIYFFEV